MGIEIVFFTGTGMALALSLRQFDGSGPSAFKRPMFWIGLAIFSVVSRMGLYHTGFAVQYPKAQILLLTSIFSLAPLMLWHYDRILSAADFSSRRFYYAYYAVLVFAFGNEIYYQTRPLELQLQLTQKLLFQSEWNRVSIAVAIALGLVIIQLAFIYRNIEHVIRQYDLSEGAAVRSSIRALMLGFLVFFLAFFIKFDGWLVFIGAATSFATAWVIIAEARYPKFFAKLEKEVQVKKYARTSLEGIDVAKVKKALGKLMDDEQVYTDENLRIQQLAAKIGISSNQLSRLLNEEYTQNFFEFINTHRVAAAKEILRYDPGSNILAIAYKVGFNSKSAFNANFARITGLTPSAYRSQFKDGD